MSQETIEQYELQIHAAQLESQKRRLQIQFAERQIKEFLIKQDQTKRKRRLDKSTDPSSSSKIDLNVVHSADFYTQQRARRDLAHADREVVRSVLLRELGGDTYVPPAMSDGSNQNGSSTSSSATANQIIMVRTGDKVHPEISFHCTPMYRFIDVLTDTCNFYGVPLDDFELVDNNGVKWDNNLTVSEQYKIQFAHNVQPMMYLVAREQLDVGRIYNWRHPKPAYRTEEDVALEGQQALQLKRTKGAAAKHVPKRIQRVLKQMGSTIFVIILMSIALVFRRSVQSMYFMTQSVRTKLIQQQFGQYMDKSFRNMKDIKDVYEWMEGPLVDAVQCDVNGDTQCIIERSFRQIGALRLRQLRVKKDATCSLTSTFPMWESERSKNDADSPLVTFVENCIGNYWELPGNGPVAPQDGDVEKEPYGPAAPGDTRQASLADQEGFVWNSPTNASNIQYISTYKNSGPEAVLQSWWVFGEFALYGPGGYIVEFAPQSSTNDMRKRIQALKHGSWIDEQTRAIIIGVNFYNGNYNYYVTAQMKIEFGTTGAIKSTEKLLAFPIDVFDLNGSSQALAGEIMLFVIAVVIIGVVAEHIATAYKRGCCVHCSNFYNALSFSAYGIYFLSQMLRLGLLVDPSRAELVSGLPLLASTYIELAKWGEVFNFVDGLEAIALICMYGTLLQYYSIFPAPHTVLLTVSRAAPVFVAFMIFFCCILVGYAILANNSLGMYVPAFRTLLGTVSTLMQTASGEVDLRGSTELTPQPFSAYVILFSFTFVVKLVVLNCAIAIITFVYSRTMGARQTQLLKEQIEGEKSVYYDLSFWEFLELLTRGLVQSGKADKSLAGKSGKKAGGGEDSKNE